MILSIIATAIGILFFMAGMYQLNILSLQRRILGIELVGIAAVFFTIPTYYLMHNVHIAFSVLFIPLTIGILVAGLSSISGLIYRLKRAKEKAEQAEKTLN